MRAVAAVLALSLAFLVPPARASDTFRFRLPSDPTTFDWTAASTNFETYVLMNIMEGLVEIDHELAPVPALAQSWDVSTDGLRYVFHLRKGVRWTDGVALSARDFVTSWRRLLAPGSKSDYASFLFDIANAETYHQGKLKDFSKVGVMALDASTLEVRLRRVVPYFLSLLSFWVTFPQREDLVRKKGWDTPANLVTLGPYRISRWLKGQELDFERNPAYHGKAPRVEHVVAYVEPDNAKARKLFYGEQLDALLDVTGQDLADFSPASGRRISRFDYIASVFLMFNTRSLPLANLDLRRAIAQSIDPSGLQAALSGGQVAADSLIPPGVAGYEKVALPASIGSARHSLLAAGYRSPGLVPPLELIAIQGQHEALGSYLRAQVRTTLNIDMILRLVSPAEFFNMRRLGRYQMAIWQWGADYPDASSFMDIFLSRNPLNQTGWKSPRYDSLVTGADRSLRVLERLKAYSEAQQLLVRDDVVVVPLYFPKITALVAPTVQDLDITPLNYLFFKNIALKPSP